MSGILSIVFSLLIFFILLKLVSSRLRRYKRLQLFKRGGAEDEKAVQKLIITIFSSTVFLAVLSIIFGHYSRFTSEYESGWILIPIMFSYFYIFIVLAIIFLVSKFDMSGYR